MDNDLEISNKQEKHKDNGFSEINVCVCLLGECDEQIRKMNK